MKILKNNPILSPFVCCKINSSILKLFPSCDELEERSDTLHSVVMHCLELNRRCDSWITDLVTALKESPA